MKASALHCWPEEVSPVNSPDSLATAPGVASGILSSSEATADRVKELLRANEELKQLNSQLSDAQDKLMQSERMASIGQLAAGVAHEINNPIGFIFSNFGTLERYLGDLFQMLAAYEEAESELAGTPAAARLKGLRDKIELEFLKEDIPSLMSESKDGITRVRNIVQNLKDFSRVDTSQNWVLADIHHGLDSTLNIVNNEIKYKAEVVKTYGEIPDIECLPSELNQVFMNLLVNAAHAIQKDRGTITIRTGTQSDRIWIEVQDNGEGIAKENIGRIFDPFFTTKAVGKGTGLGLSLSYGIVKKHFGSIDVFSERGVGTRFRVTLPIRHPPEADA
ncbi:ATP-binding protein [Acidovorax radicis]|uniref:ATP-binding protein n=1 Tax=Acidovorax radicis TaxID=758826 RepID=UPI001CF8AF12|nr:ATP-binding protein [Acidovorax radicis]UCU98123.1 ATPase [Acidovorax radicis]